MSSTSYEGFVTEPPPEDPRETVHAVDVYDTTGSLLWSRNLGTERFALVQSDENGAVFAWDGPPHGIWLDPEGEVVDVGVFEQETSETAAVPAALTVADGGRFALAARPKDGIGHYVQVHDRDANGPVSAPSWRLALVAHDSWVSDLEFHDDTLWVAGSAPDGRSWLVALDPGGQPVTCGSLPLASVDDVEISDDGESVYVLGSDGESSAVARLTL